MPSCDEPDPCTPPAATAAPVTSGAAVFHGEVVADPNRHASRTLVRPARVDRTQRIGARGQDGRGQAASWWLAVLVRDHLRVEGVL